MPDKIMVEVAYALPQQQLIIPVQVAANATAQEAIEASKIIEKFPEIDLTINEIGIFSKLIPLNTPLRAMDRVEIYRGLIADPKAARKERAEANKQTK
jgi:uncharacterized protein